MGAEMRIFAIVIASLGLATAVAYAADDGAPFPAKFPDSEDGGYHHVYVFMLKKNGIALKISGAAFCRTMGYGTVVKYERQSGDPPKDKDAEFASRPKVLDGEKDKDEDIADGDLEWVICRAKKD
jgi:hypothetical protein